jgi:hypothetical protein
MPEPEPFEIPLVWEGAEEATILFADQFAIRSDGDEFVLAIGQLQAPILIGPPEAQQKQARALSYIPIRVLGRYGLSRRRMIEVIEMLQTNLARHDEENPPEEQE